MVLMGMFVATALYVVTRFAGGWGVPYFTFTTERGSHCTNNFTGYICDPMTLGDVEFFGDVDLPDDTRVSHGVYTSTHDYLLEAGLDVPAASSKAAAKALRASFGPCRRGHPSILNTAGLTSVCVMANDDAYTSSGEPSSRLFTVGTGVRKDGVRVVSMVIKSR
jgi:hypothetical protein